MTQKQLKMTKKAKKTEKNRKSAQKTEKAHKKQAKNTKKWTKNPFRVVFLVILNHSLKELNLYFNIMNVTFCLLSQENGVKMV